MEKKLIVFSANEQKLIRISGECHYSSNKVAYVQAHFYLEDNWTGFDSVRAIWWSGVEKRGISTVLDNEGNCTVPAEVLKNKGKVEVNLVGSIVENDVLTDRLTTYPELALIVDANSKVTGTETAPVTPSQFEQFVAIVIDEAEKVTGMTAQAITLPSGSPATATYSDGVLTIGIPEGAQGETGNGIESVVLNADYTLTINYTDGTSMTTTSIRGENGRGIQSITKTGTSGLVDTYTITFDDGTTTTFTVTNGEKGEKGDKGDKGDRGETGQAGADGFSPVVTVTPITGGHEVSIEDATQTQTFDVMDGVTPVIPWDSILPIDTASGDIASFPDGSELVPARSVKVELEPIQDLHGYDKPWSGGNGKNLFDASTAVVGYYISDSSGELIAGDDSNVASDYIQVEAGQTYRISPTLSSGNWGAWYDEGKNYISGIVDYSTAKTAPSNAKYMRFTVTRNGSNPNYATTTQVEKGSDATSYEPYSNECPIYGRTECVTERTGSNIFGGEVLRDGVLASMSSATDDAENRYVSFTATATATQGITVGAPFKENTAYTFILDLNCTTSNTNLRVLYTDGTRVNLPTVTANTRAKVVFVSGATKTIVSLVKSNQGGATRIYYDESGVFEGVLTADQFEAYNGHTYTTALGRTVYGGDVEQVGGSLTDKMGFATIDGNDRTFFTEVSQATTADGTLYVAFIRNSGVAIKLGGKALSNSYEWKDLDLSYLHKGQFNTRGAYTRFVIADQTINTLTKWRDWLTANPLQLCYELATPQSYSLTGQDIDLLHGTNNLWSDGEIEVEYNADIQLYIEKKLG